MDSQTIVEDKNRTIPYYLITNKASLIDSKWVQHYPRHLLLAHLLLEDSNYLAYVTEWIREARASNRPLHVILDNGAYEKQIVGTGDLIELVMGIAPDVVVMPDAVGEPWEVTWQLGEEFVKLLEAELPKASKYTKSPRPLYMFAGQGRNPEDVLQGYNKAINTLSPRRFVMGLGLAYKAWAEPSMGNSDLENETARIRMVEDIFSLPRSSVFRWHILGARWNPTTYFNNYREYICGLDTYKPCQSALLNMIYPGRNTTKLDHRDPHVVDSDILEASIEAFGRLYGLYTAPKEIAYMSEAPE